jgi:hypothetical protein
MLKILTLATATAVALGSTAFAAPRVERVAFASHGEQIVGDLYLPEEAASDAVAAHFRAALGRAGEAGQ